MKLAARHGYSLQDYHWMEEGSDIRHEYYDGNVYAMAGGSPAHARISANIIGALTARLRGGPCYAVSSDMRVALPTGLLTYPDAAVYCGDMVMTPDRTDTATNPTVVVEVLSPGTRSYDLGDKREHYATAPTLMDIVLVEYERVEVVHWRRIEGVWQRVELRDGGVQLVGVDATIPLSEIYDGVLAA